MSLNQIVNMTRYPLDTLDLRKSCKETLDKTGALVLHDFLQPDTIDAIRAEGETSQHLAYFTDSNHNVYLQPADPNLPDDHPRNRQVVSSKGCITTDQIPSGSKLSQLYHDQTFQQFLCSVLDIEALYEYADPLSSINLHYAREGQELGWHFDNSSFAITLLIEAPAEGGSFEYVKNLRNADDGDMNFDGVEHVLDGKLAPQTLELQPGTLSLFRGQNSMHRVTPVIGNRARMLAVLAYNTRAGIALSESARKTFYGRLS